jgi:hypothetical protein
MPSAQVRHEAKAARRVQNQARWASDPRNANCRHDQVLDLLPEAAETISGDAGSLDALRRIMLDGSASVIRRVTAAEAVLAYELAPGALARSDGVPVASGAYAVLRTIAHAPGIPEAIQFRAHVCLAQIENARASKTDPGAAEEERRLLIQMINAVRREHLRHAGAWKPAPDVQWYLTPADTIDLDGPHDPAALLAVRASNRDDESWRQLLQPKTG